MEKVLLVFDTIDDLTCFVFEHKPSGAEVNTIEKSVSVVLDEETIKLAQGEHDCKVVHLSQNWVGYLFLIAPCLQFCLQ
jgi:hypothetical protein